MEISRIKSIDVARLLAAFLVVCIHCWRYPGRDYILPIARVAVPLFFLICGFFLSCKTSEETDARIKRSIRKISTIWIIGTLLYLIDAYQFCHVKGNFSKVSPSPEMPLLLVLCCHQKIAFHLWFLIAMVEGLLAMRLSIALRYTQRLNVRWQWTLPIILILVGTMLNKYYCHHYPLFGNPDLQYPPVIFMSWPFIQLGYCFAIHRTIIDSILCKRQHFLILCMTTCGFFSVIEGQYAPKEGDNYLLTLPFVLSFFALLILNPNRGGEKVAKAGRHLSLWIYVLHVLVYMIIQRQLGTYSHWMLHPFTIFIITLLLALLADLGVQRQARRF